MAIELVAVSLMMMANFKFNTSSAIEAYSISETPLIETCFASECSPIHFERLVA